MSTQPAQPEALRLAAELEGDYCPDWLYETGVDEIAAELRRLHAYAQELESQVIVDCMMQGTPATGGEPVAWWIPKAEQFALADKSGRPFVKAWEPLYTSPQPVREPLSTIDLMRVVMKADEESQDTRGTTNWAAHIGKAVQTALLSGGAQPVREPLTDEQITCLTGVPSGHHLRIVYEGVVRATEQAHGIKGGQHGTE